MRSPAVTDTALPCVEPNRPARVVHLPAVLRVHARAFPHAKDDAGVAAGPLFADKLRKEDKWAFSVLSYGARSQRGGEDVHISVYAEYTFHTYTE